MSRASRLYSHTAERRSVTETTAQAVGCSIADFIQ